MAGRRWQCGVPGLPLALRIGVEIGIQRWAVFQRRPRLPVSLWKQKEKAITEGRVIDGGSSGRSTGQREGLGQAIR